MTKVLFKGDGRIFMYTKANFVKINSFCVSTHGMFIGLARDSLGGRRRYLSFYGAGGSSDW